MTGGETSEEVSQETRRGDRSPAAARATLPRALFIGVLGVALLVLLTHAARYFPFISDDTLISLRYAERLLDGLGLTWNDGERVEGYSNLLWVLACAGLGLVGFDLVLASRLLGVLGMSAAIAGLVYHQARRNPGDLLPAFFGALAMALTGSFAIWAVGGLEQPLVVALLVWALVLLSPLLEGEAERPIEPRRLLAPGLLYGLLCLTRPDGALFVACGGAALLVLRGFSAGVLREALWLALPSVLLLSAQLAFRLAYYGDWVPNTAYSKVAFTSHRLRGGLAYYWGGLWPLAGLALPALLRFALMPGSPRSRSQRWLWTLPLIVWSAWVIVVGGDIFPGRRHLVVVVALLAFLAADFWADLGGGARDDVRKGRGSENARWPLADRIRWPLALGALALLGTLQWSADRTHLRALDEIRWAQQGEALGRLLGRAYAREQPLLAVTAAGALPFHSKLPALDMLGLNDRYLAEHPPEDLGRGRIGHELGDGAYFMRRAPDLVIFCGTRGRDKACSRGGREMQADPRFAEQYRLVNFIGTDPIRMRGRVWLRERGGAVGIRAEAVGERIRLPGPLLNDLPGSPAALDAEGRIGALVPAGRQAVRSGFALAPGRWRVEALASDPVSVRVSLAGAEAPFASGSDRVAFDLPGNGPVALDWVVRAEHPASDVHLRELILSREAPRTLSRTP